MAYFPNGSAGEILDNQCAKCEFIGPDDPCPVMFVQNWYNYEQVGNKDLAGCLNYLVSEKGICQMRQALIKSRDGKIGPAYPKEVIRNFWKQQG